MSDAAVASELDARAVELPEVFPVRPIAKIWVCIQCTSNSQCIGVCPNGANGACLLQRGPTCNFLPPRVCFCTP